MGKTLSCSYWNFPDTLKVVYCYKDYNKNYMNVNYETLLKENTILGNML